MILLDTHVLLWLRAGDSRLGSRALDEIDQAWSAGELAVSAISFWEVAILKAKGRIRLADEVLTWRRRQLEQGMIEIAVDGEIGIRAASLEEFHPDPADRIIVASALSGYRLVTADSRILGWTGSLDTLSAVD